MDLMEAPASEVKLDRPLVGDDLGPEHVTAEDVTEFRRLLAAGALAFPGLDADTLDTSVARADPVEFTALFRRQTFAARDTGAPSLLTLRALALYRAVRTTAEQYLAGVKPLGGTLVPAPQALLIAREALEDYLEEMRGRYGAHLADPLAAVSPRHLAELTELTENMLGVWRMRDVGPRYYKPSAKTVRYPIVAVLAWIEDVLPASYKAANLADTTKEEV